MASAETQKTHRALALDALRGIAIVLMCLSGRVPFDKGHLLPRWMYHAQEYPGGYGGTTPPAGFTWVDWVFPMFLFSMGVAFPFAQSSRLRRGATTATLIASAFVRGILIAAFAIYFQHVQPDLIDVTATLNVVRNFFGMESLAEAASWWKHVFGFIGFLILIPIYTRMGGGGANPTRTWLIKGGGILLAVLFLATLRYHAGALGTTFNIRRSNIILMVLANMAFFGTTVWLLTRSDRLWRWVFLALFYVLYEAAKVPGNWLNYILWQMWKPIDWLYSLNYLKYLFIVIPATMIGEELMEWQISGSAHDDLPSSGHDSFIAVFLGLLICGVMYVCHLPGYGGHVLLGAAAVATPLIIQYMVDQRNTLLKRMALFGSASLVVGFVFQFVDGGIRKTPSNMAYYFVSLGLSIYLLMLLTIMIDLKQRIRWFRPLIATGQNPMAGYLAINNVMEPLVFVLSPILAPICALLMKLTNAVLAISYPWHLFSWAVFKTAVLVAITGALTRMKMIWRT